MKRTTSRPASRGQPLDTRLVQPSCVEKHQVVQAPELALALGGHRRARGAHRVRVTGDRVVLEHHLDQSGVGLDQAVELGSRALAEGALEVRPLPITTRADAVPFQGDGPMSIDFTWSGAKRRR